MSLPSSRMSEAETWRFLQEVRHAVVATRRRDGSPQVSPVWYAFQAGRLYFAVHDGSAKAINMRRDARIAVCIDAGHPDARSVTKHGNLSTREVRRAGCGRRDHLLFSRFAITTQGV